jgi:hypothetical protein
MENVAAVAKDVEDRSFVESYNKTVALTKQLVDGNKEVRVVDAKTGGEKGTKLARFDLVPPEASYALAEVYGYGCRKYADRNWERGYAWGLSIAALERHLNAWKRGFTWDTVDGSIGGAKVEGEHTGAHHLMQVAWHAFALFTFQLRGLGTDDRRGA